MIHQVMSAEAIAAIFLPSELAPLRFFDFASDGGDDHIALEPHSRTHQRFHSMRVTDECALHVVDTETIDHAILHYGLRLVTDPGEKLLAAGIRCIHVAVKHQVFAAAGPNPTAHDIGAALFDFLPSDVKPELL